MNACSNYALCVLAFCFCLLDLRIPGCSHGNVIIALYNGKVLLWIVGLSLLLLYAIRYLDRSDPAGSPHSRRVFGGR